MGAYSSSFNHGNDHEFMLIIAILNGNVASGGGEDSGGGGGGNGVRSAYKNAICKLMLMLEKWIVICFWEIDND